MSLLILIDMVIKSYHIILAVNILGWFLLKWAGFGELLGWKSSTRSGNTGFDLYTLRLLSCTSNVNAAGSGQKSVGILGS